MSEFFKALEQAERDRLQQEQGEATSATATAPTAPTEHEAPAPAPVVAERAVADVPSSKTTGLKRAAPKPAADPPPAPAPSISRSASTSRSEAPSPVSVFRPSLGARHQGRLLGRVNGQAPSLVTQSDPTGMAAEAYRTVRANIELMSENDAFRHIAITSVAGGDGKSTTAANLAVVAAQGGRRVCLVDADLRRPTLHDIFGLPNVDGLASAVQQGKPLHTVARSADIENLSIVVAGRGGDESYSDVLTPQRLENVLRESSVAYDLVIFDSPPIMSADALSVAAVCGGVILVVRAGTIPFSVLRRAIGQVAQVKGRVLGVLLNQANLRTTDARAYGYYRAYDAKR